MQLSAVSARPCFAARPLAIRPRRAGPVKTLAVAARDEREEEDGSGVLSGEWAPTWSLGLPTSRASAARNTIARGTANEEGTSDPANILAGEWAAEHEWALETYDEVKRIACEAAAKRHAKNGH
ncbi:hypothetical protein ABPG77_001179 [Micractinium sp. CCAP 211/92]